jgi:hypothetical protein
MTDSDPIACSLDGNELKVRLFAATAVGRAALISHESANGRHRLRFRGTPEVRERLEGIVDGERRCCPFLKLELTPEDDAILLLIEAPPGAEPSAAGLAAAFVGAPA